MARNYVGLYRQLADTPGLRPQLPSGIQLRAADIGEPIFAE